MHSEVSAVPAERMLTERELLAPLPSLRASIGKVAVRDLPGLERNGPAAALLIEHSPERCCQVPSGCRDRARSAAFAAGEPSVAEVHDCGAAAGTGESVIAVADRGAGRAGGGSSDARTAGVAEPP